MRKVTYRDKVENQLSIISSGSGKCTAHIYTNETTELITPEEGDEELDPYTVWHYDATTFSFTPGKFLTAAVIESSPSVFVNLSGDVDKIADNIAVVVQEHVDKYAQERGYDNCFTACGYKDSSVLRFQVEATILSNMRDECWKMVHLLEAKAQEGDATAISDLLYLPAGLPVPDFSSVPEITE